MQRTDYQATVTAFGTPAAITSRAVTAQHTFSQSAMLRIVKYILMDILRNKIVLGYTLFLLAVTFGLFNLNDNPAKGLISLLNILLIFTPLVSLVFSTIYFYNSYEFIELLAAQPLRRSVILWSQYLGLGIALSLATGVGVGVPLLIWSGLGGTGLLLLFITIILSWVFVAIALLASVMTRDKAKGIGVALLLWFYFSLLYDAIVLLLMFSFNDYPLEKAMLALVSLNPIDLGRVIMLLQMDVSALMGYSGAIFREFLGTIWGMVYAGVILCCWIAIPLSLSFYIFKRKDF